MLYEVITERAFLCALPRKLWPDWAAAMARLLPPGGLLAGYFFVAEQLKGPPFGIEDPRIIGNTYPAIAAASLAALLLLASAELVALRRQLV